MTEDEIVQKHKEAFDLLGDFLDVLDQSMSNLRIDVGSGQQVMMGLLAERLRSTARACVLVSKNGFSAEARALARVCVEIIFKLRAIHLDKESVRHYAHESLFFRKKALTAVTTDFASSFSEDVLAEAKNALNHVEREIAKLGAKKKRAVDWAKDAKLDVLYKTQYSTYSGFVHAGSDSMREWFATDEAGKIIQFITGSTDFELTETLRDVSTCIKCCLIDLQDQFSLDLPLNFAALRTKLDAAFLDDGTSP